MKSIYKKEMATLEGRAQKRGTCKLQILAPPSKCLQLAAALDRERETDETFLFHSSGSLSTDEVVKTYHPHFPNLTLAIARDALDMIVCGQGHSSRLKGEGNNICE